MSEKDFRGTSRWLCPKCERAWCDGIAELSDHLRGCTGLVWVARVVGAALFGDGAVLETLPRKDRP